MVLTASRLAYRCFRDRLGGMIEDQADLQAALGQALQCESDKMASDLVELSKSVRADRSFDSMMNKDHSRWTAAEAKRAMEVLFVFYTAARTNKI
jgi:hypothetical protein